MRYFVLCILLCTSLVSELIIAQNSFLMKHYITVENGLSHNEVTSIQQDEQGFIWIGTRGGLNRYDGYEMKIYNQMPGDTNSLINPSIEELYKDSKGNIWIGTKSGGISKYNPQTGQFKNFVNNYKVVNKYVPVHQSLSFFEDYIGNMWIASYGQGVFIYNEEKKTTRHLLDKSRVISIMGTDDNRIFIGCSGKNPGVFEYNYESDSLIKRLNTSCRQIQYDRARNVLWIVDGDNVGAGSLDSGLTRYDLRNNKYVVYNIQDKDVKYKNIPFSYFSVFLDSNGKVWLGTWGSGLYVFSPENESFERVKLRPTDRLQLNKDYDAILDIFEDNDKNIWIGTNGAGVCMIADRLKFNSIGTGEFFDEGLKNVRIMSVLEDTKGNLWMGTIGDGLVWSPDRIRFYNVEGPSRLSKDRFFVIKYLFEDSGGTIWVGTNLGQFYIKFKSGVPTLHSANSDWDNIAFQRVIVSMNESDDFLWLGSLKTGIYLVDKKTKQLIRNYAIDVKGSDQLKSNRISYIFKDSRERMWLGTYNGLYVFNYKDSTINLVEDYYHTEGMFTGNIITSIGEDNIGNIWIGTPNGINRITFENDQSIKIKYYTEEDGLASNFIKGIANDKKGGIWFSTNTGITRFFNTDESFINFDHTDGVQGNSFIEASSFINAKGEIFFGGTYGLTFFNPDQIQVLQYTPKTIFTGLKILNKDIEINKRYQGKEVLKKSISVTDELRLNYNQNNFELYFSAIDYISDGHNKYKYILQNQSNKWNLLDERRFVVFNNLSPGEYVLKIKSANKHGVWSKEPLQLKIIVEPPFWRTWYALVFYILFALVLVSIVRWNAIKQVRLSNSLEMEKVHHEQDLKITEMKIRFFTNISHEFKTPITLILAPLKEILSKKDKYQLNEELTHKIHIIQNNALRLMKLVNQLISFRKTESGEMKLRASNSNLKEFMTEVTNSFNDLANINGIDFKCKINLNQEYIWFDRDKLEIVLNNLISNAFKYTKENGKIEVSVYDEEEEVLISVNDNGPGIPSHELDHIFERFYSIEKSDYYSSSGIGLALTKKMIELHKGNISVSSEPNVYTEFIVSLPKGKKHLLTEEIVVEEEKEPIAIKSNFSISTTIRNSSNNYEDGEFNILVVDDNQDVCQYLLEILQPYYNVETANNGFDGLNKIETFTPHLIISDVMMPKMDGFNFFEEVYSNEKMSMIPFIFLSANSDEELKLQGTKIGAVDFIHKPFDPMLLLEKVKNILLRNKALQQQFGKSISIEPSALEISTLEEKFIKEMYKQIEENLHDTQFTSEVLANKLNRSYSSLNRKVKKITNLSTAELIRSFRIKRAALLLNDKDKTVSEIAYEVGFNDVKHFRTVFQKQYKCSPSKYRERL